MNVWIYDENSYPSGFAGGFVPGGDARVARPRAGLPRGASSRRKLGRRRAWRSSGSTDDGYENVTAAGQGRRGAARGHVPGRPRCAGPSDSPWYGGKCYVDLLYPGVTEKFLEVTLDAYQREIGDQFGKRVPGVVHRRAATSRPAGGLPWTRRPARGSSRSAGATACSTTCPAWSGRSATGSRSGTTTSRSCSSSSSSAGPSRTTTTARSTASNSPATTGSTSGRTASACPTTWPCTPGSSGPASTA